MLVLELGGLEHLVRITTGDQKNHFRTSAIELLNSVICKRLKEERYFRLTTSAKKIIYLAIPETSKHGSIYDIIKLYTGLVTVYAKTKFTAFSQYEIPAMLILLFNLGLTFIELGD
jgi:hypothetical protein